VTTRARSAGSLAAEAAFRARLGELGATLLEHSWLGALVPHRVRCAEGHERQARPNDVQQGRGVCRVCAGRDPAAAEAAFHARVTELGGTVVGKYVGAHIPVQVRCATGHDCSPRPCKVQQGRGICRICANCDPATAEASFRARLDGLGATPLYTKWLGVKRPYHVRCANGHDCQAWPDSIRRGRGPCRICARNDPAAAAAAFREALDRMGATLLERDWLGSMVPHRVRCIAGHNCRPMPASVQQGHGICRVCAGVDTATAEADFRARVEKVGGIVLGSYVNNKTPILVRCKAGHDSWPWPSSVQAGRGICLTCSERDPVSAARAFHSRMAEMGAAVLGDYVNAHTPVLARCAAGHDCTPTPHGVRKGRGICQVCKGLLWDVFYVVTHDSETRVKFGITSGNPRDRLRHHRRYGYTSVAYLATDLPGTIAPDTENAILSALALAGERPIHGREYFDISCLPLILDVARGWLVYDEKEAA